ncbi:transporter substrate-binding domain-containing protein [Chromobacterium sp. S0633]|uniref:substrate-binding periplasmic protein n=1 Tax=Chromobacterium sp. S0633 TaxID=2957805 RepID=UPI00209CA306|nr:transporter substrate-binding domain-containing protein [Chromobacterium sp. S0633]MCP1292816.1 transporter substrate-binding domain-containing protein [Chromobacterium sp. S0633]
MVWSPMRLALICCAVLPPPCLAAAPPPAREVVLASGEWPPYLSAKLPQQGYASHIVSEAFRLAGITVRYRHFPWARAEAMVRGGEIAGSVVWSITPERERFALFSLPVVVDEEVAFHLAKRPLSPTEMPDLYGLRMATPNGSKLGVWGEAVRAGHIRNDSTQDIESGMRQLLAERIDFFPLVKSVGQSLLRRRFTPEQRAAIVYAPKVWERNEYRLMLSRAQPQSQWLLDRFNEGLVRLKNSAQYRRMERDFEDGAYDQPVSTAKP